MTREQVLDDALREVREAVLIGPTGDDILEIRRRIEAALATPPDETGSIATSALNKAAAAIKERDAVVEVVFALKKALEDLVVWAKWTAHRRGAPSMDEPNTGALRSAVTLLNVITAHEREKRS